jgi:type I restriction enzyme S subunit
LKPNPHWAKLPLFNRKNWSRVRFDDVVENLNETCDPAAAGLERVIAMEHLEPGSLHIRAWGNVADGTTFTRRCRPGQVLFGKRRAYQRKVAVAEFEAVVSGDIYVLAPKGDRLLPELLPFLCLSERFFLHAVGTSAGSLSPRTNWSSLASFEFDLPPLDQQHRIAEILWAVDELIQNYQKLELNAIALRDARVKEAVEKASSHLQLGEIATAITSGSRGWAAHYASKGSVFIRITNLQRENIKFDWSDIQYVSPPNTQETERTRVRLGDVLISVTAELGLIAFADDLTGESYINQHIAKVSLNQNKYDPYLASVFLSLPPCGNQFRKFNDQGAKAGMNLKNVAKLTLPALSKAEQSVATDAFRSAQATIDSIQKQTEASLVLKNCILHNLLDNNQR